MSGVCNTPDTIQEGKQSLTVADNVVSKPSMSVFRDRDWNGNPSRCHRQSAPMIYGADSEDWRVKPGPLGIAQTIKNLPTIMISRQKSRNTLSNQEYMYVPESYGNKLHPIKFVSQASVPSVLSSRGRFSSFSGNFSPDLSLPQPFDPTLVPARGIA